MKLPIFLILIITLQACEKQDSAEFSKTPAIETQLQQEKKPTIPHAKDNPAESASKIFREKLISGKWSEEEAIIAGLRVLAGEADISEIFGAPNIKLLDAEGILGTAESYLRLGEDESSKDEIRRLQNKIFLDYDVLESESMPYPLEPQSLWERSGAERMLSFIIPDAQAENDCTETWRGAWSLPNPVTGDCINHLEWEAHGRNYKIHYPGQWHREGYEEQLATVIVVQEVVNHTQKVYSTLGETGNVEFWLGAPARVEGWKANAGKVVRNRDEFCRITVFKGFETDYKDYVPVMAHELFHCFQGLNMGAAFWNVKRTYGAWWREGSAMLFADYAYPERVLEINHIDDFDQNSVNMPLHKMEYETIFFFYFLFHKFGPEKIIELLKQLTGNSFDGQADSIAKWPGIQETFHEFGQAYMDKKIKEAGGNTIVMSPDPGKAYDNVQAPGIDVETEPLVLHRAQVSFARGNVFTVEAENMTPPPGKYSVKKQSMELVSNPVWIRFPHKMPSPCSGFHDYQLLLTSVAPGSGKHRLNVKVTAGEERESPRQIDTCLTGKWQSEHNEEYTRWLAAAFRLGDHQLNALKDQSDTTLCFDEAGTVETQLDTSWMHSINTANDDVLDIDGELKASGGGEYEISGDSLLLSGQLFNYSEIMRGRLNGKNLGISGNPDFRLPDNYKPVVCMDRNARDVNDCTPLSSIPSKPKASGSRLIPYECQGNTLFLAPPELFETFGIERIEFNRIGDKSDNYDGVSKTGYIPAPDRGNQGMCESLYQELESIKRKSDETREEGKRDVELRASKKPDCSPSAPGCIEEMERYMEAWARAAQRATKANNDNLAKMRSISDQLIANKCSAYMPGR